MEDGGEASGKLDGGEGAAALERTVVNGGDASGQHDGGEGAAAFERTVANGGEASGHLDGGEGEAALERISADGGEVIGQRKVRARHPALHAFSSTAMLLSCSEDVRSKRRRGHETNADLVKKFQCNVPAHAVLGAVVLASRLSAARDECDLREYSASCSEHWSNNDYAGEDAADKWARRSTAIDEIIADWEDTALFAVDKHWKEVASGLKRRRRDEEEKKRRREEEKKRRREEEKKRRREEERGVESQTTLKTGMLAHVARSWCARWLLGNLLLF